MTVTTISTFEVQSPQAASGSMIGQVRRQSAVTLSGLGLQGSRRITVAGNGTSETLFSYDLAAGTFLGSTGQSVLRLRFETIQQTEEVLQRSSSRISRRP